MTNKQLGDMVILRGMLNMRNFFIKVDPRDSASKYAESAILRVVGTSGRRIELEELESVTE